MFNKNTAETRTFFLKTSSSDFERKTSNADFVVHTSHTPVELNNGVTGVSLVSATFPQNQANIISGRNVLRFSISDSAKNDSFAVSGADTIEWRRKEGSGNWSIWYTHTASGGEIATFTDMDTMMTALNANFKTSYTTAFPSASANDVEWESFADFMGGAGDIQNKSIATFQTALSVQVEFKQTAYLTKLGIDVNRPIVQGYTANVKYMGRFAPNSYSYTVPVGQYTIEDISTLILTELNSVNPGLLGDFYTAFGEISAIDQRPRLTTTALAEAVVFWGCDFGSTIGPCLGISDGVDADIDGTTFDTTFSHVANLHGPMVVYLYSQLLAGRTTLDGDTGGIVSIVKQIPIVAAYRELQVYNNDDNGIPDISFPLSRRKHFSEIDIILRDQHGNVMDLGAGSLEVMWKLYY